MTTTSPASAMERTISRVAIYARVSSEQQAQQQTIASQLAALGLRVEEDGFTLDEELRFIDDGHSGTTLQRPALERLRDQAYAGAFQRLYVHSPDRLARKYAYQVLLVEELRRAGVELVFLNHAIGVSPEEDLLLQMQGMIAEYERAKILERSRRGKRHAAQRGSVNVLCGAPYGYRYVTKFAGAGVASYQIHPEHAPIVRQIFEWIGRDCLSIGEVCRRLKAQCTPSPKGKSWWDRTTVWGMLKNPAYYGSAAFGKSRVGERRTSLRPQRNRRVTSRRTYSIYDVPAEQQTSIPVPAIVGEELFAAVQEQLNRNQTRSRESRRGASYLLQGLTECGCCGCAYYGKKVSRSSAKGKTPYAYYRCVGTDGFRFGGKRVCDNKQVRTDMLDNAVWQDVRQLLGNPALLRAEYERRLTVHTVEGVRQQQLKRQVQQAERTVSRLIDAYEDGLLEKSEFEPRVRQAKQRLANLRDEQQSLLRAEKQRIEMDTLLLSLEAFVSHLRDGLDSADWTTRRELIRTLVKSVKIEAEQVRITYRISQSPFVKGPLGGTVLHFCWWSDLALVGKYLPALV